MNCKDRQYFILLWKRFNCYDIHHHRHRRLLFHREGDFCRGNRPSAGHPLPRQRRPLPHGHALFPQERPYRMERRNPRPPAPGRHPAGPGGDFRHAAPRRHHACLPERRRRFGPDPRTGSGAQRERDRHAALRPQFRGRTASPPGRERLRDGRARHRHRRLPERRPEDLHDGRRRDPRAAARQADGRGRAASPLRGYPQERAGTRLHRFAPTVEEQMVWLDGILRERFNISLL